MGGNTRREKRQKSRGMEYTGPVNAEGLPVCCGCGVSLEPGAHYAIHVTPHRTIDRVRCIACKENVD